MRRKHRRLAETLVEALEDRRLLAADLVAEIKPPAAIEPGEVFSYQLDITNRGDTLAQNVVVEHVRPFSLDQFEWTRETTQQQFRDDADLQDGLEFEGNVFQVSDVNNDSIDDILVNRNSTAHIVFGSSSDIPTTETEWDGMG